MAEAIEAGEPLLIDKITGEIKKADMSAWVEIFGGEILHVENAYRTLSGKYIIIARNRTGEEEAAASERNKQAMIKAEARQNERMKEAIDLPGYILIALRKSDRFQPAGTHAYYLPVSGPRFVFQKCFKYAWEKNKDGYDCLLTLKAGRDDAKLSRWPRKEIADTIKNSPANYHLYAPLWLLTSIPDPRPRYLAGKE